MPSKQSQIQCLVCKKMTSSKNLKRHYKTRHGMDDEEYNRIKIKIYSCKYCKKLFARSINCLYHELHCQPREAGDVSYRADFQFGTGTDTNGGFEEIQLGRERVCVVYRKQLSQTSDMDNLKSALTTDAITVLQKEVAVQTGIKWYFGLTLTFRKAPSSDVITDPPVVLHTAPKMGLMGTNYERELSKEFEEMIEKIDTFERNGSGWVVDKFLQLDLNIVTYTPWSH